MKKLLTLATAAVLGSALLLTGCGEEKKATPPAADKTKAVTIKVGASPTPHAEILTEAKERLAKDGVTLEIVEFTDYVQPNLALNEKSLDANYFQHVPYMEKFASEHNLELASVGTVHVEPMALYSRTAKQIDSIADGSKIAIPNDATNGGRALILLHKTGLITLKDPANILATKEDVTDNPHNFEFVELEAAQLPRSLDDVGAAVINTNYAIDAGLVPTKDALAIESKDSPYANIITVRSGDESRPEIQKLLKALQSAETKKFIEDKYQGAILPAF